MNTQYSIYKVAGIGVTFGQAISTAGPICWQEFTFYDQEGEPVGRVVAHLEGPDAALAIGPRKPATPPVTHTWPGTATGDRAMNTALQISHPQNLDAVLRLTDADLFTPEMLARALDLLADVAGPLVADVNDEDGRREINRMARAVGGAIARLDERRRHYVAALKAQPKAIDDLFRVTFRQPAEALKEQVRAPLTAWEEDIRAADEETTRLVELLNTPVASGTTAADIRQRLDAARDLALPDWLSTTQRGEIVAALERNIPRLEAALEAASRAEEQAAELARLRTVARDAELLAARTVAAEEATRAAQAQQAAREEQVRQEAAATARAAALAEVAQQRTPAPPTAAPEREDRALIHRAILADLEDLGIPTETAKRLIAAIARGQIFHLAITY